jgi:hypothetical protein
MTTLGVRVLAKAEGWKGIHESPAHSNRGPGVPGVSWFESHDFVAGDGYPWCVTMCLSAYAECGHPLPYRTPGAWALLAWHQAHTPGWIVTAPAKLKPGAICIWKEGSGHASIFKSYDATAKTITTIDGNWNDAVQQAVHPVAMLKGAIVVPDTAKQVVPVVKAKPPMFDLATSHNGHVQIVATNTGPVIFKRAAAFALNKANLGKTFAVRRHGKTSI